MPPLPPRPPPKSAASSVFRSLALRDPRLHARAVLWFAGTGTLTAAAISLSPLLPDLDRSLVLWLTAGGAIITLTVAVLKERTPNWLYFAFLLYGTAAIALANAATGVVTSPWLPYYFWLTLYAAYFLGTAQVVVHQVLAAAGVAVSLWTADTGGEKPARWATHVLALAMTAFVVHRLRIEIAKLVGRLHVEASTDPLTGAFNRGTFDRDLVLELAHATAAHVPVSLLLIDLDRFKSINDAHGHPVGDQVLKRTVDVLLRRLRAVDRLYRVGGEEFAVILRGSDVNGAIVLAEDLRVLVESESPAWAAPVTISVGVAAPTSPQHTLAPDDLVAAADEALYQAKHAGRNCVCVAAVEKGRVPALGVARSVAM